MGATAVKSCWRWLLRNMSDFWRSDLHLHSLLSSSQPERWIRISGLKESSRCSCHLQQGTEFLNRLLHFVWSPSLLVRHSAVVLLYLIISLLFLHRLGALRSGLYGLVNRCLLTRLRFAALGACSLTCSGLLPVPALFLLRVLSQVEHHILHNLGPKLYAL